MNFRVPFSRVLNVVGRIDLILFVFAIVIMCNVATGSEGVSRTVSIEVSGTVQKVCVECDTVDLVNGGVVAWDVVTVRLASPKSLSGVEIAVNVLLEDDGVAQRQLYIPTSAISFVAPKTALDARRVMLHPSDIREVGAGMSSDHQ
jgi:hypothetical protein